MITIFVLILVTRGFVSHQQNGNVMKVCTKFWKAWCFYPCFYNKKANFFLSMSSGDHTLPGLLWLREHAFILKYLIVHIGYRYQAFNINNIHTKVMNMKGCVSYSPLFRVFTKQYNGHCDLAGLALHWVAWLDRTTKWINSTCCTGMKHATFSLGCGGALKTFHCLIFGQILHLFY